MLTKKPDEVQSARIHTPSNPNYEEIKIITPNLKDQQSARVLSWYDSPYKTYSSF